jgi:hypothetical protein
VKDLVMPRLLKVVDISAPDRRNRIYTKVHMFMMDSDHFLRLANSFNYGEISALECRVGVCVKHPDDDHNPNYSQELAESRYKKILSRILHILSTPSEVVIQTEHYRIEYSRLDHSLFVSATSPL